MRLIFSSFVLLVALLLSPLQCSVQAGTRDSQGAVSMEAHALIEMGMEDVRVRTIGENLYVSFEDNIYRGNYRGIAAVVAKLREVAPDQTLNLVVLSDGVAQISVVVPQKLEQMEVSYSTDRVMKVLKGGEGTKPLNRRFGKSELVLYPELYLENSWFDKIYGYAVNISPALEVSLWRGAELTGQVIFPISTNMTDEKNYIRPGFITFRQSFRLPKNIMGDFSVGNFDTARIGADMNLWYNLPSGRFSFGVNGGYTGSSTHYLGEWEISQWQRFSGSLWALYYEPKYDMEIKVSGVRMIYGDMGVRADLVRHFGEVAVSLYAMQTEENPNGGFSFTIPFPCKRRWARNPVRVTIPEEFSRVYKARSGRTDLTGFQYTTRPDESWNRDFYNPDYIRERVLRELTRKTK